ncbi:hypothetical protein PR202_gb22605 [Eleusine coracana subsp. coracana]|uniref:Apple domain-containing protein n=1 Tax=Eleusine coracana subsp. coracana TaxID=191504 RepID=A0AAV5FE48_ELECO|nr:hypothetical protein PR202_gb22605 [Eleusine coracana subsp. coracana]
MCLVDCECVAYAATDIRGGGYVSGCAMWKHDIVDVRYVHDGQDIYVRLARSELGKKKNVVKIVLSVMASVLVLAAAAMYLVWICKRRGKRWSRDILTKAILGYSRAPNELGDDNIELPFVSFADIATATNKFSEDNMLGQGGFGKVYKRIHGAFSVKSDTYSFGVILLEIISGLRITSTHFTDFPSLLAYAWSLWNDGKAIDLVDSSLAETCSATEALLCIHIGLLCVQDNPNSRPLMSSVVSMLENETAPLSVPKQPLYFSQWYLEDHGIGENNENKSTNKMSVTVLEGR